VMAEWIAETIPPSLARKSGERRWRRWEWP
jgi:hypothetical protein